MPDRVNDFIASSHFPQSVMAFITALLGLFAILMGHTVLGFGLAGFSFGTSIVVAVLTAKKARRDKKGPPPLWDSPMESTYQWTRTLTGPYPSGCAKCGESHKSLTEAYRWHVRRRLWLEKQRAATQILGLTPVYWIKKEAAFLDDLGLTIPRDLRANIEYLERVSTMFGVPSYFMTPPKKGP